MESVVKQSLPQLATPPQRGRAILSATVRNLQLSGWLLFGCLWLPVARGCNGTNIYPIKSILEGPYVESIYNELTRMSLIYAWGHGLFLAITVALTAFFASRRFFFRSFVGQSILVAGLFFFHLFWALSSIPSAYHWLRACFLILIPSAILARWLLHPFFVGDFWRGWARIQYVSAAYSFVVMNLACIFGAMHVGYFVGAATLVWHAIAVEIASRRMEHDLWNANRPVPPIQFTILQIFAWMTIPPFAIAYFKLVTWLLPP